VHKLVVRGVLQAMWEIFCWHC